jgi:uncharacterized RDD family membrane protein YckC
MTDEYYILVNGGQTGPYTFNQILQQSLDLDTQVSDDGGNTWQRASDMTEFFQYFEARGIHFPTEDNLAGFWLRLLGYLVDSVILGTLVYIMVPDMIMNVYQNYFVAEPDAEAVTNRMYLNIITFVTATIYNAVLETTPLQGSLGKKICKIIVVDADGRRLSFIKALGRNAGKFISGLVLWLGYFSVLWDEHKQAWHDKWASTYVIIRR